MMACYDKSLNNKENKKRIAILLLDSSPPFLFFSSHPPPFFSSLSPVESHNVECKTYNYFSSAITEREREMGNFWSKGGRDKY
jgi:hypothetical protein